MPAVAVIGTGQTPYNTYATVYLPAGVNRYFVVSSAAYTPSGQGVPPFGTMTFTLDGTNVPMLASTYRGTYGNQGWAAVWGLVIPDNKAAGNYGLQGVAGHQRNSPYAFFSNVHPTSPLYSGFTAHHGTPAGIGAIAYSMDPSGGGYFIVIGVENSGSGYLVSNNVTNLTSSDDPTRFGGVAVQTGGTKTTTFSSGPTTAAAAGLIGTLRSSPSAGGGSVIWWFRKWLEQKKKGLLLQPFPVGT